MKNLNDERRMGPLLLGAAVALVSLVSTGAMTAQGDEDGDVDTTRAALERWVETRRIISQEKRDWALGREVLNDRIDLVQRDIASLQGKIEEAQKGISEADRKRAELAEENDGLAALSKGLAETVAELEASAKELLRRLPDPIRERVQPLSQQLPDDPGETKLGLGDRYANVVGLLNEVNKFQREITVTSEVRTLQDGTTAEVTSLYVGIGQGYYCTADEDAAGIGSATEDGWTWTPANEAAGEIARAIAILQNEQAADFVRLPVRIQ